MNKPTFDNSSDYGFFCDLENTVINDYERVEYYVETTRTHYEVRRKMIRSHTYEKYILSTVEPVKETKPTDCLSYLVRVPRDIYYSLIVCFTTISCVVIVMTYEPTNESG